MEATGSILKGLRDNCQTKLLPEKVGIRPGKGCRLQPTQSYGKSAAHGKR